MKLLKILVIAIVMLSALAYAGPPMPAPVKGVVYDSNGQPFEGLQVEVTNTRTGEVLTPSNVPSLSTQKGIYVWDMSAFKKGYSGPNEAFNYAGDTINVKVGDTTLSFIVGEFPYNMPVVGTKSEVSVPVETVYVCSDGSKVSDSSSCPKVEQPDTQVIKETETVTVYKCEDGSEVDDVSQCPDSDSNKVGYLIGALLVAGVGLGWVKGFAGLARYYKNKGDEEKKAGRANAAKKFYERANKMLKAAYLGLKQ